ncbi:amidinotransferase [Allokutzneria oryzae]|uniref:Amidinotransferase n=1 Tax=Allokutzneria oryzae TaxID=1378989 RepID=A0ABV5ZYR8_9PSEU
MIAVAPSQPPLEPWQAATAPANPTQLARPAFLMNAPFSYAPESTAGADEAPRPRKAFAQFFDLYNFVASEALVTLLPTPSATGLPELVFTANLGVVLEHHANRNTAVISNYTTVSRRAETVIGVDFLRAMGYDTHVPETHFEGEADLKHLHGNVYVGGYGQRSEVDTYDWMERTFDMKVVRLAMTDPGLPHLERTVFPLTKEKTLVCTELYQRAELVELERHTEIIDVSVEDCRAGACGSVRLHNVLLNSSHIHDLRAGTEEYHREVVKNRRIEDIASSVAFEVNYVNLSEYRRGGALLSGMLLHLNRFSYAFQLL